MNAPEQEGRTPPKRALYRSGLAGIVRDRPPEWVLGLSGGVLVEEFLDGLRAGGGSEPLVDVEGLPQEDGAVRGVAGLDVAAADPGQCVCFF